MTSIAKEGTGTRANSQDMFIIIIIIIIVPLFLVGSGGFWGRFPWTVSSLYQYLALLPGIWVIVSWRMAGVSCHTRKAGYLTSSQACRPGSF